MDGAELKTEQFSTPHHMMTGMPSRDYLAHLWHGDDRLRVTVHVDRWNANQSWAVIEIWSATSMTWNEVDHLIDGPTKSAWTDDDMRSIAYDLVERAHRAGVLI